MTRKPPASATTPRQIACAIYARVSTTDKGQDVQNQLFQLREYAARGQWRIAEEFIDHMSGASDRRPSFDRLFVAASRRAFDVVLVWALDRFTRGGVLTTFQRIEELRAHKVEFESYTEPQFRTTGPAGELMLAVAAWIAKQERLRISERTKAGMDRARRAGKHCGRPKRIFRKDQMRDLRAKGMSLRAIARELRVSFMTVARELKKER